jgi:hypothetical protein
MMDFVFFEDSWNESNEKNRRREVLDGRISPTRETSDDTKASHLR